MHLTLYVVRICFRIGVLTVMSATLCSCALPFYWQAIGGQLELLRKRAPIEDVLSDPATDERVKSALSMVPEIRRFAYEDLALPRNESYTTYVDLDRQYVVWNVIATDEFSVDPKRWCYPFTGCVAYRGFFSANSAARFRDALDRDGLDTYMAGATAYSTLGYFADPILSTMIDGGEQYIASVLFHELAHQRLYVQDDSALSEAFATAVEEYGTERWVAAHGDADALTRYRRHIRRRADFAELVDRQQARLREVYSRRISPDEKRLAKAQSFETMRAEYASLKKEWDGAGDFDYWFSQPLNNAMLAAVATYRRWLPALKQQLEQLGPEGFYAEMEQLAAMTAAGRQIKLETWNAELPGSEVLSEASGVALPAAG